MLLLLIAFRFVVIGSFLGTFFVVWRLNKRFDNNNGSNGRFKLNIFQEIAAYTLFVFCIFCALDPSTGYDDLPLGFLEKAAFAGFGIPFLVIYLLVLEAGWSALLKRQANKDK